MRRLLLCVALVGLPASVPAGEWLAGDLHVHTTYSHDVWDPLDDDNTGPDELYTLGHSVERQFAIAASRGLDYVAITDHNRILAHTDPGFGAYGVLGIHAYEKSLRGHAQMLGARTFYGGASDDSSPPDKTKANVEAIAAALRADGGVFQTNHPTGGVRDWPRESDWGYFACDSGTECATSERYDNDVRADAIEVWNIQFVWQPPLPSGNPLEDALRYWEGWLDRGEKIAATGGSDNHWLSTTAAQGVGQPTTWVWTDTGEEPTNDEREAAILRGICEGRTFVTWQPPSHRGPEIFLEADADGDGTFEAMVGDDVAPGATFRVRVKNAPPGSFVRLLTGAGEILRGVAVPDPLVSVTAAPADADFGARAKWIRAELVAEEAPDVRLSVCGDLEGELPEEPEDLRTTYCSNRIGVLALTSAIYVDNPASRPCHP